MAADSAPAVPEHHDTLLTQHLRSFLGDIEPAAMALLRERLTWVEIAGGQTLMEQGAPGDSMYLSISGRLRAYVRDEEGVPRMVREMGRGQVIGEMSLYTDEPRSASVVAIRDSVLVRLDKAHFAELLASSSQVSMALTRQIIRRLQTQHDRNPVPLPVTIALLPVSDGIDLRGFADKLAAQLASKGRVIVIDSLALDAALGEPGAANGQAGDAALNRRISMHLDNIESEHEFVLLVGDDAPTAWTRRCCRHGDEMLLLADATKAPVLHPIETDWLSAPATARRGGRDPGAAAPGRHALPARHARAWLARRPVTEHVHIRPDLRTRHGTTGAHREPHRGRPGAGRRRCARFCPPGRLPGAAGARHRDRLRRRHQHRRGDGGAGGVRPAVGTGDGHHAPRLPASTRPATSTGCRCCR